MFFSKDKQLGLGTMYFGSKIDDNTSFTLLDTYYDLGGALYDTANKYASWINGFIGGESEVVLGKWMKLKKNRNKIAIISKVGFSYGEIPSSLNKQIIISECEKSLQRLQTDHIDIYFAHTDDYLTPQEEYMEAFNLLVKQGKIAAIGASNFSTWRLAQANTIALSKGLSGFSVIQQRHTLLETSVRADTGTQVVLIPEMTKYCTINQLAIMAYSPLLGGIYNKHDMEIPFIYQSFLSEKRMKAVQEISVKLKTSPNCVVLAWMLRSSPPVIPIMSGSKTEQITENMKALSLNLTEEQMAYLNSSFVSSAIY